MRLLFPLILTGALLGCSSEPTTPEPTVSEPTTSPSVTADAGAAQADNAAESEPADSDADVFVIDVRTEDEWNSGHVEQAAHIPHTEIAGRISEVTTDKDAKIVVYCAVGGRAGKAKDALEQLGYTNVENGGGYDDVKERFK